MTALLIWLQLTALALMTLALARALFARISNRWAGDLFSVVLILFVVGFSAWVAFMAHQTVAIGYEPFWLFHFFLSMTIFLVVGGAIIFWLGGKRPMTGAQAAARWPIIALALACVVIAGMLLTTIEVAYQFSLPRLALIKSGAADAMIRILPPVPPEEENAATYYDKAQAMAEEELEIYADSFSALRKLLDKGDEEAWRKVNISIKKREDYLSLVKKAASISKYSNVGNPALDQAWPDWNSPMPRYSQKKEMAGMLALEARLLAREGKTGLAIDNIELVYNVGRHTAVSPPYLVSTLIGLAITDIGSGALEKMIEENPPDIFAKVATPVQYRFINGRFIKDGLSGEYIWSRAVQAGMAFSLESPCEYYDCEEDLRSLGAGEYLEGIAQSWALKLYVVFGLEYDLKYNELYFSRILNLSEKPSEEFLRELETFISGVFMHTQEFGLIIYGIEGNKPSVMGVKGDMQLKPYIQRAYVTEARYYLAKIALAARIYHSKARRYPTTLADLTPEYISSVPIDPFDGMPLKMAATPGGLAIYSVGPDQVDNGGAPPKSDSVYEIKYGEDIVFTLGQGDG